MRLPATERGKLGDWGVEQSTPSQKELPRTVRKLECKEKAESWKNRAPVTNKREDDLKLGYWNKEQDKESSRIQDEDKSRVEMEQVGRWTRKQMERTAQGHGVESPQPDATNRQEWTGIVDYDARQGCQEPKLAGKEPATLDRPVSDSEEAREYARLGNIRSAVNHLMHELGRNPPTGSSSAPVAGPEVSRPVPASQGGGSAGTSPAKSPLPATKDAPVAGVANDNRYFLRVKLADKEYRALFDSGATLSLVGPRLAEKFKNRLEKCNSSIRGVTGAPTQVSGILKLRLDVDGKEATIPMKALNCVDHDMILGIDFCKEWNIETKLGQGLWRVGEGPWRSFDDHAPEGSSKIHAECAGICELDHEQKRIIEELIDRIIPPATEGLGTTPYSEHCIRVREGTEPVKQRPRRMSPLKWQIAHEEVKKMLEKGIIERSASSWSSAPVIVKKSDGSNRFCVDYRDLNKVTIKDAYPLPNMDSILDKLRRARFLTKIDLKQAYFQVPMEENSRPYTAFAVPGSGLWQFTRMPFGLSNAPMTLQRLVDSILGPELEPYVFVYLDDIIVITETFEEHVKLLEDVLKRLVNAGLTINRDKCEFGCSQVTYLGFLLDHEGLRLNPERIKSVLEYPAPRNVKQMRRFLGMVNWYAKFIPNDAEKKIPLVKLLRKDQEWTWGEEQQQAFSDLKKALTEAPVLARPDFSKPFTLQCDASGFAIGAVLTQDQEDGEHPIVYASRVLSPAERNYSTTERECLALIWAMKKLRPYLECSHFTAVTDHSALKWLQNLKEPSGRLARWAIELMQWDVEIVHRKGSQMLVPDALSRMFETEGEVATIDVITDPWYIQRREQVLATPRKYKDWKVERGVLYRHRRDELLDPVTNNEEGWRMVVPQEQRNRVLSDAHAHVSSGHLGIEKTYDKMARDYYWPGMWHDTHAFIKSCPECQKYKVPQFGQQGTMGTRVVERPWAVVAADMMEFPQSKGQYKHLLVFQDLFTRWIELKPVRSANGKAVAQAFEELILFRWETPDYLLTDNGKEFDNKYLKATLDEYGVKHVTTPPYHPQANPVERSNRTLKTMIATFVEADHRTWDQHLHEFRHAINTAMQSTTKVSPAFLNFGRHPRPVKSLRREVEKSEPILRLDPEVWINRMKRLDALRDLVAKHIDKEHERQKKVYNKGKRHATFQIGDMVLVRSHVLSSGVQKFSAKLAEKYNGPFRISAIRSPTVYEVEMDSNKRVSKIHVSDLKRWIPRRGVEVPNSPRN